MATMVVELPEKVTTELRESGVSVEEINEFIIGAVQAWLRRYQATAQGSKGAWSEAFRTRAEPFVDQLIRDNRDLFDELARR